MERPDAETIACLADAGLIEPKDTRFERLTGGVSSDIWRVESGSRVFCVKRALSKLRVAADWFAPIERNRFEVAWCRIANDFVPGAAPRILHHDDETMLCAMAYLDPGDHLLWKDELRAGRAEPAVAAAAGDRLSAIHAGAAGNQDVFAQFPRTDVFQAIRLEPYLEATATHHPDLRETLMALSRRTVQTRLTMIHGDVSPKNILIGPEGPVFLDAECACIGDPAFDLAFCLNHFLLKCLWTPAAQNAFHESFTAMATAYLDGVVWEDTATLEARAATLLPGLFLARIDGKSPVEYITAEEDKDKVRRCARRLLSDGPEQLGDVLRTWKRELAA